MSAETASARGSPPGEVACACVPRAGDLTDTIQQCLHEELF